MVPIFVNQLKVAFQYVIYSKTISIYSKAFNVLHQITESIQQNFFCNDLRYVSYCLAMAYTIQGKFLITKISLKQSVLSRKIRNHREGYGSLFQLETLINLQ